MMRSLYSGVSGLKTHQTKMDVIGNNIANVNTVGFKSSSVTFSDIMYQTTSGASGATANVGGKNAKQIGLGVATAATKVSITASGAAQTTGEAFDLKLTDSNSTNFFIVSNGTENLFTRAGSFYIDGSGNLAMTSTGYYVMGWQVDPATGDIRKDTVSALRVMQADNMTSAPEATTNANVSGIIDKNDTNVTSDDGYFRTLTFFDNLGYPYTAKFSFKAVDVEQGQYSVELVNLYDSGNNDVLAEYMNANNANPAPNPLHKVSDIFGSPTTAVKRFSVNQKDGFVAGPGTITTTIGGVTYAANTTITQDDNGKNALVFSDGATPNPTTKKIPLVDIFGGLDDATANSNAITINNKGQLEYTYPTTNYGIEFNTNDGTFRSIDGRRDGLVMMNLKGILGDSFENIEIDFSHMLNQNNGGSSTAEIEKGAADGKTGIGKKLGALTGLSVDGSGRIYGSYDNGNTVLLGQIPVAQFANASGLESLGNNCYGTTLNSGDFDGIGVEVTADGGSMSTGQLEMSNVDLSAQFTEMITTQRGFQANSRIITTSDTMLEELVNLKR